jgi:hypothetical protein
MQRIQHALAALVAALTLLAGVASAQEIPPRPPGAPTGSQFLARTRLMTRPAREAAILAELKAGNVPDFLREPVPVQSGDVWYWTLPDYLAIGTDADFVRIPMNPLTAQRVADAWGGWILPTRKMVDATWRAATVRLAPQPLPPGPQMMSNDYFARHQAKVEQQRAGKPLGALTAGDKKDVVLTSKLLALPGRVAIYGWHYQSGTPIQPLSLVHEVTYADYSHGVRLVWPYCLVRGGEVWAVEDVLKDATLHRSLSDEGPLKLVRIPGA